MRENGTILRGNTKAPFTVELEPTFITAMEGDDDNSNDNEPTTKSLTTMERNHGSNSEFKISEIITGSRLDESSTLSTTTTTTTMITTTMVHDDEIHDEETLFVGDKTLFSQDNTIKALQEFSTPRTYVQSSKVNLITNLI